MVPIAINQDTHTQTPNTNTKHKKIKEFFINIKSFQIDLLRSM